MPGIASIRRATPAQRGRSDARPAGPASRAGRVLRGVPGGAVPAGTDPWTVHGGSGPGRGTGSRHRVRPRGASAVMAIAGNRQVVVRSVRHWSLPVHPTDNQEDPTVKTTFSRTAFAALAALA